MRTHSYVVILALAFSGAASSTSPFASTDELSRWLNYYYLKPQPKLTVSSLPVLDAAMRENKNRSLADEVSRGGLRSFYARIFAANDAVVRELEASMGGFSEGVQAFAREALRRCDTVECDRLIETLKSGNFVTAPGPSAPSPSTLDDSWAAFFATGDTRYVER